MRTIGGVQRPEKGKRRGICFLGLAVGDSVIDNIARCTSVLPNLERITFMEPANTLGGERRLLAKLSSVQIQVIHYSYFGQPSHSANDTITGIGEKVWV